MPKTTKKAVVIEKDYPLSHVPKEARTGLLAVTGVLIGFTFFTPTMAAGARLGAAFPFSELIWILLAGSAILGFYVAIICAIGAKTGLTSVLLSRYTLGSAGAKWADIILGGTQVLWYAITAEYMGILFAKGLGLPGWEVFFIIFWSVIMGATALYGFKSMAIVSYVAMPLMIALVVIVTWLAFKQVGSMENLFGMQPTSTMTITVAITVIVGTFASGGTQAANWARFAKDGKTAFVAAILSFLIGNGIMVFSGMIGGFAFQTGDLIEMMITMGLTFWALIILTLNIWTTNNATAYAFGVAGAEMFNKPNKGPFIIGGVVIATIVAVAGVGAYFIPLLNLFGTFIPPLGGVIIGDFFFIYKKNLPMLEYVKFKRLRIAPLIAYLAGCAAAYFGGIYEVGVPSLQGIIIAALAVPAASAILKALKINDMHEVTEDAKYV
jgi:Purine-cytosine permease and related proteins